MIYQVYTVELHVGRKVVNRVSFIKKVMKVYYSPKKAMIVYYSTKKAMTIHHLCIKRARKAYYLKIHSRKLPCKRSLDQKKKFPKRRL
jgi:hypothetical protein